ncbi:MAG: hypothetical protein SFT93_02285 [Rickettsiaceae bacterium]|nr:hypothetical protein [Rickettsiaceae bacterium]
MTKKETGMTKVVAGMTIAVSSPRRRGSSHNVIPSKEGIQEIYFF